VKLSFGDYMKNIFVVSILSFFCLSVAASDRVEVNLINKSQIDFEKYKETENYRTLKENKIVVIKNVSKAKPNIPTVRKIDEFYYKNKVDTSKLDQLDKDMFYMAVKEWSEKKIIKKFSRKISQTKIKEILASVKLEKN
jgi:hypothetical protein